MGDEAGKQLGDLLDEAFNERGPARKRVGASGPYFAKPADALRDPGIMQAVKEADKLAGRLKLKE